jgi:Family of unknown function (DUF5317)
MIIPVTALAAILIPLLLGGRLSHLAAVPFRHAMWIVAALAVQVVIIELLPGPPVVLQVAHIATYGVAGWFVVANRRIPGLWLVGTGAGLNGLAITINGGTLPARLGALQAAGLRVSDEQFTNSGLLPHPRLAFLGDIFAIPASLPLANVFSIGDVLIVLGTGWTAWALLGTRWTRPWTPTSRRTPIATPTPTPAPTATPAPAPTATPAPETDGTALAPVEGLPVPRPRAPRPELPDLSFLMT